MTTNSTNDTNTNRRRTTFWIYGIVGLLMIVLGAMLFLMQPQQKSEPVGIGGAFALLDGNGNAVTEDVFASQPRALMFGFTHCPDICPAGLARMRSWQNALGDKKEQMRFAFVTVDPQRDTPKVLAQYVGYFSDDILPLSGTPEQITAMLKAYGVYAKKVPLSDNDYTMDHHSSIFLFDSNGQFIEFIYTEDNQETAIKKLQTLIAL